MKAPKYMYAENKVKKEGGTIKERADEYDDLMIEYGKLILNNNLSQKLDEAGLVNHLSKDSYGYGLTTICSFYELVVLEKDNKIRLHEVARIMGMGKRSLNGLIKKVEKLVPEDFVENVKERRKYW